MKLYSNLKYNINEHLKELISYTIKEIYNGIMDYGDY